MEWNNGQSELQSRFSVVITLKRKKENMKKLTDGQTKGIIDKPDLAIKKNEGTYVLRDITQWTIN